MKLIYFLFLTLPLFAYSQYSDYYKLDANVNVNQNVDVSGSVEVNKTVKTIDYGALAQANAMREKNKLSRMKFQNEKEKEASSFFS